MSTFTGKTVLVTGAGSGIGRATAIRLIHEGARVIATDLVPDRLDELETELLGKSITTVAGDVSDDDTVQALVEACGGTLDGLANVAGIMDSFLPLGEVDDTTWERVLRINLTAPMRVTRAVLPMLLASGHGSVVNVASEAAFRGSAAGAAYTASKHAIAGLTRSTAFMYGPQGLRVNAVAPGATMTNMAADVRSDLGAGRVFPLMAAIAIVPAEAAAIAASIVWLLSEEASNVNGVILPSDGGWSVV
ncbi:SDR family NAD(P)-dependent oxidoreductase [Curtobacterium sp. ISL-83]|uniref:SDR family NAD(P)-dependent oxidoreductase n=1 Tax=Curtobacterium sp. ISL-83 TaxID=2819145 RepID=UPI001BEC6396|nr:SDR family NAD(P)-dependent oxidoreductase [Curtobacterium sp. ISL-83]MBT2502332.1 SDR family NAD(P)-dependent oxidoreductase [Curtobacterium sp. ISL-83]